MNIGVGKMEVYFDALNEVSKAVNNYLNSMFYNKIFTRECSLISNLQKNIKYDLKEEKPIII